MRQSQHVHRARGFVFLTAVLFVGLVAAAILALAEVADSDARRTGSQINRAQLKHLQLAAAADALGRFDKAVPIVGQTWELEMPESAAPAVVAARVASATPDQATVLISASLGRDHLEQSLQVRKTATRWEVVSARLNPE